MNATILNAEAQNVYLCVYIDFSAKVATWSWVAEAGVNIAFISVSLQNGLFL